MDHASRSSSRITVITLTRGRPDILFRAIKSVALQKTSAQVLHRILIDDCASTEARLAKADDLPPSLRWERIPRACGDHSGPGRSSRLRNYGVHSSSSEWIAFLDDDNAWEPNHLQTLLECAERARVRAAHSHLKIFHADGRPYLDPLFVWERTPELRSSRYWEMVSKGVYTPHSNVYRDRADPLGHPDPVRSVDTSAWLLARTLLLEVPFSDEFTTNDEDGVVGEDDKLLQSLILRHEGIASTNQPTLLYYLGGYSNAFDKRSDEDFAWR